MADDIEYVLLNKKECYVYNVPPATSASGYKASEWSNCIWKGRLQLCAKGEILIIKLLDASTGAIFAACPIPPNVDVDKIVDRTVDSSRYFVLTMSDKSGRKAYLGMGFDDRNDAFDFNATIQDFRRQKDVSHEVIKPTVRVQPAADLSLKEGQKISVQLRPLKTPPSASAESSGQSFSSFLPPPPSSKSRSSDDSSSVQAISSGADLLDLGDSAPAQSSTTSRPTTTPSVVTTTTSLLD